MLVGRGTLLRLAFSTHNRTQKHLGNLGLGEKNRPKWSKHMVIINISFFKLSLILMPVKNILNLNGLLICAGTALVFFGKI